MQDDFGNDIVEFHRRYKPLPPGYKIVQLDSGHYLWVLEGVHKDTEGFMSWDKWWVRRCAFAHHAASLTPEI
jgi:hypothetical protein